MWGLNPSVRRLFAIVRSLLTFEFSRELKGLQALKVKFRSCKPLNFRENLSEGGVLFTVDKVLMNDFRLSKLLRNLCLVDVYNPVTLKCKNV